MAWNVAQIRHNASVLYNHLCSDHADQVYVDAKGHLQFDDRAWLRRQFSSLGDYSREATDKVVVRTLRRMVKAIKKGEIDQTELIPDPKAVWIRDEMFANRVIATPRFHAWGRLGADHSDEELAQTRSVCSKVNTLALRIQSRSITPGHKLYDTSSDDEHTKDA